MNITEHARRCVENGFAITIRPYVTPNGTRAAVTVENSKGGCTNLYTKEQLKSFAFDAVGRDVDYIAQDIA